MNVALYIRVSTDAQAEKGYSIDTQLSACREKAQELGCTNIIEYIDDGYSGEFLDRPHMNELREALKAKLIDVVICYDPDRLARNLSHQLIISDEIEKSGAKLVFVSVHFEQSPEGRLFYSIRGAVSSFEKEKIRERTMRGKRGKALKNKLTYNDKAFGYDFDQENSMYIINEKEAVIIKYMFEKYLECSSIRGLRQLLLDEGIVNRRGKPFDYKGIQRILKNEQYAGTKWAFKIYDQKVGQKKKQRQIRDKKEWVPIIVPEIVSKELFNKVQERITNNIKYSDRNTKQEYLLKGVLKCAVCGSNMTSYCRQDYVKLYKYYTCNNRRGENKCNARHIPSEPLDSAAWEEMLKYARGELNFKVNTKDTAKDIKRLQTRRTELEQKRSSVVKWYVDNMIDSVTAEKELKNIGKELVSIDRELSRQTSTKTVSIDKKQIRRALTFEEKRRVILDSGITFLSKREGDEIICDLKR